MKRISCVIIATIMVLCLSLPVFAASSKVTVKNTVTGSKPITYTYDSDAADEVMTSIKTLMTVLSGVTNNNTRMQTLTITSESADSEPVNFKLRLSLPKQTTSKNSAVSTPSPDVYSSLDYYNIKIYDGNGSLLYNSANDKNGSDEQRTYKDIPLGTLNTSDTKDSKTFGVSISVNKDLTTNSVAQNAKNLDWSLVSYKGTAETEETPAPSEPAEPENTPVAENSPSPEITPYATAAPAPAATVKADKNGIYNLSAGDYTAGNEIDKGVYTMTGSGLVNVYSADGTLKNTVALKSKGDKSSNGVNEYILNLANGERINVESGVTLEPYAAPTASPTPSPSPKATTTASSSSSSANSSKTNPKTGDNAPLATVSAIGILALVGFAFITIKKRNNR